MDLVINSEKVYRERHFKKSNVKKVFKYSFDESITTYNVCLIYFFSKYHL